MNSILIGDGWNEAQMFIVTYEEFAIGADKWRRHVSPVLLGRQQVIDWLENVLTTTVKGCVLVQKVQSTPCEKVVWEAAGVDWIRHIKVHTTDCSIMLTQEALTAAQYAIRAKKLEEMAAIQKYLSTWEK